MKTLKRKVIVFAGPLLAMALLSMAACEGHHHRRHGGFDTGSGHSNKGDGDICYERVLNIDKHTGQAHYEDRAVPCKK